MIMVHHSSIINPESSLWYMETNKQKLKNNIIKLKAGIPKAQIIIIQKNYTTQKLNLKMFFSHQGRIFAVEFKYSLGTLYNITVI